MSVLGQSLVSLVNKVAHVSHNYNPVLNIQTIDLELNELWHHLTSQMDQNVELFPGSVKIYTYMSALEYRNLYAFSRAAMPKCHQLDGSEEQKFIFSQFWKEGQREGVSWAIPSLIYGMENSFLS